MHPFLRRMSSMDLLAFVALGGEAVRGRVEAELDRRAGTAEIRRILQAGCRQGRRPAVCETVGSPVAA